MLFELHRKDMNKKNDSYLHCLDYNDTSKKGYQWNCDVIYDFEEDLSSLSIEEISQSHRIMYTENTFSFRSKTGIDMYF